MRNYSSNLAFIDLLFNLILGITFLFIVAFILINDPEEKEAIDPKAEYMIVLTWDNEADIDIDLWVDSPSGIVGFRSPQQGHVHLDKDDLGHRNDYIYSQNKEPEIVYINREVVTVRGIQAGEYTINAFYYFAKQNYTQVTVNVEVIKLNPFAIVYEGSKKMDTRGQEETMVRFSMKEDGSFYGVNNLPKEIVRSQKTSNSPSPSVMAPFSSMGGG